MSAEFWMGIAIGSILPWLVILIPHFGKKKPTGNEIANELLRERNAIGERQAEALEDLAIYTRYQLREVDAPVFLMEASKRPLGSISRIHQYDAKACVDALNRSSKLNP